MSISLDLRVLQQHRGQVVEGGGDPGVGQQGGGLLGGAALVRLEGVRALLVEAERVDAVDDELAGERLAQRLQGLGVALPRHGHDHDVAAAGALGVVGALDAEPELVGGGPGRARRRGSR